MQLFVRTHCPEIKQRDGTLQKAINMRAQCLGPLFGEASGAASMTSWLQLQHQAYTLNPINP